MWSWDVFNLFFFFSFLSGKLWSSDANALGWVPGGVHTFCQLGTQSPPSSPRAAEGADTTFVPPRGRAGIWAQSCPLHPSSPGWATALSGLPLSAPFHQMFVIICEIGVHLVLEYERREWQPTPEFLPGESHGQRSLAGHSPRGRKESDTTERLAHTRWGNNTLRAGAVLSSFPHRSPASPWNLEHD